MSTAGSVNLGGIVPPLSTPLTADGEVDTDSLVRLTEYLLAAGVHGLFVLGSTGEVAFLRDDQRGQVIDTVVRTAAHQVPVVAGVIDTTTPRVIPHLRQAEELGADQIVVTAPFYTRTHPAEIEQHFRLLAAASSLPIIAYDIPVAVHTKFDPAMLARLGADGVLAGVKDSSGDDAGMRGLVLASRPIADRFVVLTGSELTTDNALAFGAQGAVPGLGNVDPDGYVRLWELVQKGDLVAARAEQDRLYELFGLVNAADPGRMGAASSALGAFKAALQLRGVIDCARTADPYLPLNVDEIARVRTRLEVAGLL
ncbi:dihydrodipicolinate synthase family protein [Microlunatus soli]|uniref:4-hydroxy-tetrahydrodipicolinate synthase n=1 Tax=Microlunatus soli TaxID=630515 RepID=A0A1H1U5H4_9ACTN|nr:dihydrodipicolinate synthase family protein [Microlunatus soli]SDS67617.1 4-hydroxy-tetrahydrodipicolinate synthase [Microlunatus soli]